MLSDGTTAENPRGGAAWQTSLPGLWGPTQRTRTTVAQVRDCASTGQRQQRLTAGARRNEAAGGRGRRGRRIHGLARLARRGKPGDGGCRRQTGQRVQSTSARDNTRGSQARQFARKRRGRGEEGKVPPPPPPPHERATLSHLGRKLAPLGPGPGDSTYPGYTGPAMLCFHSCTALHNPSELHRHLRSSPPRQAALGCFCRPGIPLSPVSPQSPLSAHNLLHLVPQLIQ